MDRPSSENKLLDDSSIIDDASEVVSSFILSSDSLVEPTVTRRKSSALDEDEFYPKTFQDELNEIMEAFYSVVTEEQMYAYQAFVESIAQRKVAERALKEGTVAPDFELEDQDGDLVNLGRLVEQGPVVLVFYRGKWCPHCNAAIMALSNAFEKIKAKGATLVAISPMLPDGTHYLATKRSLLFSVCSDMGNVVAKQYNITFEVKPEFRDHFLGWGEDVPGHNGDDSWEIPLPATYIIDQNRRIVWSFLDNDPGVRAAPDDIVAAIPTTMPQADKESVEMPLESYQDVPFTVESTSTKRSSEGGSFNRRHLSVTFKSCTSKLRRTFGRKKQPAGELMSGYLLPPMPPDETVSAPL